jgi:hypothetical protein
MPLHDHFAPPLSLTRPWEAFHSAWASQIAAQLNGILPADYVALPQASRGPQVEIDVATLALAGASGDGADSGGWSPGVPTWGGAVELAGRDLFEVRVVRGAEATTLVGAVELVSPANKDRPAARRAFAGKCAGYLRGLVGLVTVDVVTTRHQDLHRELLELLELDAPLRDWSPGDPPLAAVAYRTATGEPPRLELWPRPLTLGEPLPTLPLWLSPTLAVPLDLEASYQATCAMLRMA